MTAKLLGFLLVFTFFAPPVTSFMMLKHQKRQVKREIKWRIIAGIDKEELVLLKFGNEEKNIALKWKHEREFAFQGEMYDVVEIKILGDSTYYWCWWDHEETKLNKQLSQLVSAALGNDPKNHEHHNHLQTFFKSLYLIESEEQFVLADQETRSYPIIRPVYYQSLTASPPSPPPCV